jgi:membrane associated rhomboid family serine protease
MRFRDPRSINLTPIWVLIALNLLIFVALFIRPELVDSLGVSRSTISTQPWTIVSAMFTHQEVFHILFNMLALYFYGMYVLALVGEVKFFIVYFLGGLVGNLLFILMAPNYSMAIGASGAVFALGGVLVMLVPRLKVMIFPIPAAIDLWIAIAIIGVLSLSPGVAWQAHLGGLLTGLAAGYIFKLQSKNRRYY